MKIILASGSPRRKMILEMLGYDFDIIPSTFEEHMDQEKDPAELVEELALGKAKEVASRVDKDALVIGSDTIVVLDNLRLGKPKDREDCIRMLNLLSGKTQQVFTAICILYKDKQVIKTQITDVTFRSLSQEEIEHYADTDEPYDKAGGYALQGDGAALIGSINGCYTNVIGFPVSLLLSMMEEFGVKRF